jgi:hypothetical protein
MGSDRRWLQDSYGTADQQYLNGSLDDMRIYNRALSPTEVASLAGVTTLALATPVPVAVTDITTGATPMTVTKLSGSVKFSANGRDTVAVAGSIPDVFKFSGVTVAFDISGAQATFVLDSKGRGKSSIGTLSMQSSGGATSFKLALKNGSFAELWSSIGIDPKATVNQQPLTFSVTLDCNGTSYATSVTATYSSKAGVGGKFK